jgi:AraC-like DNA-binding protein
MYSVRFLKPAPGLEPFVRLYSQRRMRLKDALVVHPVPARAAPVIEFLFGDLFQVLYGSKPVVEITPRVVVVGLQTHRRLQLQLQGTIESFVILFQPAGFHRMFSIPMHELTDHDYEAHSVLGTFISRLEERLGNMESFEERVHVANQYLMDRVIRLGGVDEVLVAANQITALGGRLPIAALANNTGLSLRQLERRFIEQVGVRPKLYARIARFEAALDCKTRSSAKSWTDVAHEFGYFDQMHMIHEFEEFTGETPTQVLHHAEMVLREQIDAIRSGRDFADLSRSHSRLIL